MAAGTGGAFAPGAAAPAERRPAGRLSAVTPSRRTRHAELLRLCARIGYSPPELSS